MDRPKKKPKVDVSRDGRGARQGMRELLRGFARTGSQVAEAKMDIDEDDDDDTDEEDEFFDAIESNTLPNLVITDSLKGCAKIELPALIDQSQYEGYTHLRKRLAITTDDRPPMSLWAVLKNSIGKDLTKISFPVFFNEPTSMLQRMVSE